MNISIVIGSWGSYNECNKRALGSKWLDLSDYYEWEEIVEELEKEGFELDGVDEELFVQDIQGICDNSVNWDYVNPRELYETLDESGVLSDDDRDELFNAYIEAKGFDSFKNLVEKYGNFWDDCLTLYGSQNFQEMAVTYIEDFYPDIPDFIKDFIDYESLGDYLYEYDSYYETSEGVLFVDC